MQPRATMRWLIAVLTDASLLLAAISLWQTRGVSLASSVSETVAHELLAPALECSEICQTLFAENLPPEQVCEHICDVLQAQADEPCVKALLASSPEHLALLSYSSGHLVETVAIIASVVNASAEAVDFLSGLHLYDRGSPAACAALPDTHYCLGQGASALGAVASLPVALGLCLPQSCDSGAVATIVGNITASISSNPTLRDTAEGDDGTSSSGTGAGLDAAGFTFFCGDEGSLSLDSGSIAVVAAFSTLAVLTLIGSALEHIRSRRRGNRDGGEHQIGGHETGGGMSDHRSSASSAVPKGGVGVDEGETSQIENGHGEEGEHSSAGGENGHQASMREPLLNRSQQRLSDTGAIAGGNNGLGDVTWWWACLECFSLRKNVGKLLAPAREGNEFGALDGVRTMSMLWVILGHTLVYTFSTASAGYTNTIDVLPVDGHGLLSRFSAQAITGGFFAVDSFFLMSGFLVSSMLLPKLNSGSLRGFGWTLKVYLHRYLRLTPTIVFVTLFMWKLLPLLGRGPIWWQIGERQEATCSKYWWTEVTYMTNVYPFPWNAADNCVGVTWYLGDDMQFFLVGVPLVSLFHHRRRIGITTIVSILISSCIFTLWFGFSRGFSFNIFQIGVTAWGETYTAPWTRCPVYLIGMLCGFVWHTEFRRRKSANLRDSTSGQGGLLPAEMVNYVSRNRTGVITVTAVASALLMALPVYGTYWSYQDIQESSIPAWADHLYLAFSRPSWSLGLALMCGLCFLGKGGLVNWLLTRPIWVTPARLTFCAYLTHPSLLFLLYGSRSIAVRLTELELAVTYMGVVVGAFACATALHLLVEAPFRNLESWARHRGDK